MGSELCLRDSLVKGAGAQGAAGAGAAGTLTAAAEPGAAAAVGGAAAAASRAGRGRGAPPPLDALPEVAGDAGAIAAEGLYAHHAGS